MEIAARVDTIEVKRAFVVSQYFRKYGLGKKRYLPQLSPEKFRERLVSIKRLVLGFPENKLDEIIAKEYKKRLRVYNKIKWHIGTISPDEVGVWKRAGGLPLSWTEGSLADTAKNVAQALKNKDSNIARRAKRALPRMTKHLEQIEKEKYFYPIVVPGGMMGRKGLRKMKGDIDDGCMRSLALICNGRKGIKAFIGSI